jgi:hypothetical protein
LGTMRYIWILELISNSPRMKIIIDISLKLLIPLFYPFPFLVYILIQIQINPHLAKLIYNTATRLLLLNNILIILVFTSMMIILDTSIFLHIIIAVIR